MPLICFRYAFGIALICFKAVLLICFFWKLFTLVTILEALIFNDM